MIAPEHDGGHLDWYSFDLVAGGRATPGLGAWKTLTSIPAPVRYTGMPASRWWEFEDADVNLGDLDAGPADLARLLVAEFATSYRNDWFVIPLRVTVGTLSEVTRLEVIDTFGGRQTIKSAAALDSTGGSSGRAWRFLELSGDATGPAHPAPWLLVAPTVAADANGPVLEQVLLARDEGANLAWAIEKSVEGPLGRAVERAGAWNAANPAAPVTPGAGAPPPGAPRSYEAQWWQYRVEAPAPPWWIPLVPELIPGDAVQVRLRRARLSAWDLLVDGPAAAQVGPQGTFFDHRVPRRVREEEVQRDGVRLERRWQAARWHDGSLHVWLQRRKSAGRGERSSGLRWDLLVPGEGPSPAPPVDQLPGGGFPGPDGPIGPKDPAGPKGPTGSAGPKLPSPE